MPQNPPNKRLKVTNLDNFGRLVKKWAVGLEVPPTKPEDFIADCLAAGVVATLPDGVTKIEYAQATTPQTLVIRLPPKDLVEDSETMLKSPTFRYTVPDFYNELYRRPGENVDPPQTNLPQDEEAKLRLHAFRIGDYTMSNCV